MSKIEALKTDIQSRYKLDVYITSMNEWCVKLDDRLGRSETFAHSELEPAMVAANEYRFIIQYRRKPAPFLASSVTPKKTNSGWRADYAGSDCGVLLKTKKQVLGWACRVEKRSIESIERWDTETLPLIIGKVEGVDFEWKTL